jgi:hypothetical protein
VSTPQADRLQRTKRINGYGRGTRLACRVWRRMEMVMS